MDSRLQTLTNLPTKINNLQCTITFSQVLSFNSCLSHINLGKCRKSFHFRRSSKKSDSFKAYLNYGEQVTCNHKLLLRHNYWAVARSFKTSSRKLKIIRTKKCQTSTLMLRFTEFRRCKLLWMERPNGQYFNDSALKAYLLTTLSKCTTLLFQG